MVWQDDSFVVIPMVGASIVSAIIMLFAWQHRSSPSIKSFFTLMLGVTVWSFGYALELWVDDLASKNFWASIKYCGIVLVPTAYLAFALQYSGKRERLNPPILAFLAIEPLIIALLVWTNDYQGLIWASLKLDTIGNFRVRVTTHGPLFWFHFVYSYLLLMGGTILIIQVAIRTKASFRKQAILTLIGVILPWIGNGLYVFGRNPFYPFDLTPFAFLVTGYTLGYSIFRYKLLDLMPVAQNVFLESISDAVIVYDSSNRIVELNPAAQGLIGHPASLLVGQPMSQVLSDWPELLEFCLKTPEGRSEIFLSRDKTQRYLDVHICPLFDSIHRFRGRLAIFHDITEKKLAEEDLKRAHEELDRRVQKRTQELNAANLQLQKEIIERERAETENRQNQKFLYSVVENIPNMIFIKDAKNLKFIYFNKVAEELTGYSRMEIVGKNVHEVFLQEEADAFMAQDQEVLGSEKMLNISEQVLYGRMNKLRILHTKKIVIRDGEGAPQYLLGISEDITERKQAEEQLRKAHEELEIMVRKRTDELEKANTNLHIEISERKKIEDDLRKAKRAAEGASRAKSHFLANMSHELRTPLNHIIGFTEMVVDKHCGDLTKVQEEYLNDVLQSSQHLLSLINDILDLSKVEAGKLELEVKAVPLRTVLESSLRMVQEKALKHRIRLSTDIDGIPEVIQADERKLKQILYNLLSNAVKFTPDGGGVTLSARYLSYQDGEWFTRDGQLVGLPLEVQDRWRGPGGAMDISVQDTGIGIKGRDLERIFDPFEQVESSASRRYQGTGLGLSLTKRLVELHGGGIWVESEGEGKGSKFSFSIPI